MKWILLGGIVVLFGGLVFWRSHSSKSEYVNGLVAYRDLPNRQYIFERDCYIFKFKDQNTDWPLVASHLTVPDLPEEVTDQNVGADLPKVRILGVARTGDRFKIVSVRRDTKGGAQDITFEILFMDEATRKYPRLDAFWIIDHSAEAQGLAPSLRPDYAADRPDR